MKRAAIYCRYSTDLQNERSIEDQAAVCRTYAERAGLHVVEAYSDAAVSGSSTVSRYGWQRLMRDAEAKRFDIVLAEDVDRISRDEADFHAARKVLAFNGVKIHTAHAGEVSGIEASVRAMMGAHFLENLAHKVRRGLAGVVRDGRHAGGRAYGYRAVSGKPGELEIVSDEADVIRRIFSEYVDGKTPRDIAHGLNRDGIAPPRGVNWNASTINGNKARGHGILQNELLVGVLVWNRVKMIRDPRTGKRISRPNPGSEWQKQPAPELAIVDRATFDAAQARKAARSIGHPQSKRKPRHILSGLLRCAACGSGMSAAGRDKSGKIRVRCTAATESNSCPDPRTYYLSTIEAAVLDGLRRELKHPAVLREYVQTYVAERNALAKKTRKNRAAIERRLATAQRELERAVRALIKGTVPEEEAEKEVAALKLERDRLRIELEAAPADENVIALHPGALARYQSQLARLQETLEAGTAAGETEAAEAIRDLVETVKVTRDPSRRGGVHVEIAGRLNALLGPEAFPNRVCSPSVGELVAGD